MSVDQAGLDAAMNRLELKMSGGASGFDPLAELGITLEENQYETRLLALTAPDKYAAKRAAAFSKMKTVVTASYDTAFAEFMKAGYPSESAKGSALAAAEQTRRVQRLIIEQQFPSSANAIGEARTIQKASPLKGTLGPAPRRSAPRRSAPRRSAPRKSTTRSAADRAKSARKGVATRRRNAKKK
jgi:hypothetical protein